MHLLFVLLTALAYAARRVLAVGSAGCANTPDPSHSGGDSWSEAMAFDGTEYTHQYSLPQGYDSTSPLPLLLYFHGWGGNSGSCGSTCSTASNSGFATISLQGIGGENGDRNSWNGFGSNDSSTGRTDLTDSAGELNVPDVCGLDYTEEENDRTCNVNAYNVDCYVDCDGSCSDNCWWTTCKDSVAQTLAVLDGFLSQYCIDEDRIYATGCSNGGMFVHELANDERTAPYFAAIAPMVGLPHFGYNFGPHNSHDISYMGFWGKRDRTVPPLEGPSKLGCTAPCRTSESRGWFYTSSHCTTMKWADSMELSQKVFDQNEQPYGISGYPQDLPECWFFGEQNGASIDVLGCHFSGGHFCDQNYVVDTMLNFFNSHRRAGAPPPQPTPSPSTTSSPSPSSSSPPDACVPKNGDCEPSTECCSGTGNCKGPRGGRTCK